MRIEGLNAVDAYERLRGDGPSFLIERAEPGGIDGQLAYIGVRPAEILRWRLGDAGEPYALVADAVDRTRAEGGPELPFTGGAVGLFGYDLVRSVEALGAPPRDESELPDLAVMLTDLLVVLDPSAHTVTVVVTVGPGADVEADYSDACSRIEQAIGRLESAVAGYPAAPRPPAVGPFRNQLSAEGYEDMVERCVTYIEAGDAFQVVPSQRWWAPMSGDSFEVFRALRRVNPSPRMFFLDFEDFQVLGASPEPLLQVQKGVASTWPIAGTRRRGGDELTDAALELDLMADEKERAEHTMLVDLARNDLGRVSEPGSVRVDKLMDVHRYSHVMHVVSKVSGRLRPGIGAMDALRSTLPAGTLSGAPKVRAMQIIDELEPVKRGFYGGAVGWLGHDGDFDSAIVIRSAVVCSGQIHVQAGAGVVADSVPHHERHETVCKAGAVMAAVEVASGRTR